MNTVYLWGIKFNPLTKQEIVTHVQNLLDSGKRGLHLTGVNPETVALSRKSNLLRQAINDSDIVNVDGMLIALLMRFMGIKIPERAATPDIFKLFLENANRFKQTVFFLGAKKEILEKMVERVRSEYPDLVIAGYEDGYYKDETAVLEKIKALRPDYLFVALPSPQKEQFIMSNKNELGVGVSYGVGGAFDVLSGEVPRISIKLGFVEIEGIFRILYKPWNYGLRFLKHYPAFMWYALTQWGKFKVADV